MKSTVGSKERDAIHAENTLGSDLDHSVLESLGRDNRFLGDRSVASTEEELLVTGSRFEEFLSVSQRGALGPFSREHVSGETSNVRRSHPKQR
jgi:hypothetical protein